MNDRERKKQQRQDINRRAYLKRIKGKIKNYSKNTENDYKFLKFLRQKGKLLDCNNDYEKEDEDELEKYEQDIAFFGKYNINSNNDKIRNDNLRLIEKIYNLKL